MHIVIIGNGIAGTTAARFLRKNNSDVKITMISSESRYPFSRTALMYIYMGHLTFEHTKMYEDDFWAKNRIDLIFDHVKTVHPESKSLQLSNTETLTYDKLIIASGSKSNKFGWPGQELDGVFGLYHLQDLQELEKRSNDIGHSVIVGGGLIGIELAEMLHARGKKVTLLVRENSFWNMVLPGDESEMINKHILNHGIDLRLNAQLKEIKGKDGKVCAVLTEENEYITCEHVGIAAGVSPNIGFLKTSGIKLNRGVLVNDFLQTSHRDVYAIGDCAELSHAAEGRRAIEAVWYVGKEMGSRVAENILGNPSPYIQDVWYNSAKFFDIEYQVYGHVPAVLPSDNETIFWQNKDCTKSIRINYHSESGEVIGFNLMGIRFRQEVCQTWIRKKVNIQEVLTNLKAANFDPEFFEECDEQILKQYNLINQTSLLSKGKRGINFASKILSSLK